MGPARGLPGLWEPLGRCGAGAAADSTAGGGCFADMLQLINTPDNDFSGLFDLPFGAPDSTVTPGLSPAQGTLGTYLGPSKPPPAAPTGSVYPGPPGMAAFAPQPPTPLLPAPAPGVKEEPAAVPSSQPQPGVMLAPSFVPASSGQFSPQPLVGYQNQHSFSGEDLGVRGGGGGGGGVFGAPWVGACCRGTLAGGGGCVPAGWGCLGWAGAGGSGNVVLCSMPSRAAWECGSGPAKPPARPAARPARGTARPRAERGTPAAPGPHRPRHPARFAPNPASAGKPRARGWEVPSAPPPPQALLTPPFPNPPGPTAAPFHQG